MRHKIITKADGVWGREQAAVAALAGMDFVLLVTLLQRDTLLLGHVIEGVLLCLSFPVLVAALGIHYFELRARVSVESGAIELLLGVAVIFSIGALEAALVTLSIPIGIAGVLGIMAGLRYFLAVTRILGVDFEAEPNRESGAPTKPPPRTGA